MANSDKNFAILGVSLDKKKEDWLKAIQEDQLTGRISSDLQMWSSKAWKYLNLRAFLTIYSSTPRVK